jgi:site-specific DNA-methyltransferase (adenine-specific)
LNQTTPIANTIICDDAITALKQIPNDCVDLTVCSPPYDNIRDYNKNYSIDFLELGKELFRVTKEGGVCAIIINDSTRNFAKSTTTAHLICNWVDNVNWKLFECCIYQRHGNPGAWWNKRFRVDHEYILLFFKGDRPKCFDKSNLMVESKHAGKIYSGTDRLTNGQLRKIEPKSVNPMKCRGTIWQYATSNSERNIEKLKHPATFPDQLVKDLVLCFSNPNDLVLDPMCGSGTTCVVSAQNNRKYYGIEINQDYVKIIKQRLLNELKELLLKDKNGTSEV